MSRSRILDKLTRLEQRIPEPPLPAEIPAFPTYPDPAERFARELGAVGGVFLDGRGGEKLAASLSAVVSACAVTDVYWEGEEVFLKHRLPHRLRDPLAFKANHLLFSQHHGGQVKFPLVVHSKPYRRQDLAGIELSVGSAAWGIAETGTAALQVGPSKGRLLSMLPPAHATLLSERDLLMNSVEFFEAADLGGSGSLATLATGPSRTADIEKTLVIGVHGPGKWFVVLTA